MVRLILLVLLLLPAVSARAETAFTPAQRAEIVQIIRDAMRQDTSLLKDAITALQAEEQAGQAASTQAQIAALSETLLHAPGDQVAGNPKGDVTVVEFYDVRCPYCRRMLPVMDKLLAGDANIRLVYKDLPVLGPGSVLGARALLAARRQDGYLRLHAALMSGSPNIDQDTLRAAAQRVGLDWSRLERDMAAPEIQTQIDANLGIAHKLQIEGTPAYIIGDQLLPGAMDLTTLRDAVALARKP